MTNSEFRKISDVVYDGDPVTVDKDTALKFLEQCAIESVHLHCELDLDPEETADEIKDYLEDYDTVKKSNWEKVRIEPTSMALNGLVCREGE